MFKRVKLRRRLLMAVIPLVLTALTVAGVLVGQSLGRARDAERTATLADAWLGVNDIALELRDEPGGERPEGDTGGRTAMEAAFDSVEALLVRADARPALGLLDRARGVVDGLDTMPEEEQAAARDLAIDYLYEATGTFPLLASEEKFATDFEILTRLAVARRTGEQMRRVAQVLEAGELIQDQAVERLTEIHSAHDRALDVARDLASPEVLQDIETSGVLTTSAEAAEQIKALLASPGDDAGSENLIGTLSVLETQVEQLQTDLTSQIIHQAEERAINARLAAIVTAGVVLLILLGAVFVALGIVASVARRIHNVSRSARQVTDQQLPALVAALRDPTGSGTLPDMRTLEVGGRDEVGELAVSFNSLQETLREVAGQQMDTLRKGVSEIFVTLARRNRSLVDRQLATLDQLEQNEESPERLSEYYRLDHIATRMRRNAESLLVLAGRETQRRWTPPSDIGDVVRAAIGEVEDYTRIDILALEPVDIVGHAVADLAHMLSEILDNATAFSPPESRVRIAGHFDRNGYLLTVGDRGMGMTDRRRESINNLLSHPPIMGLALDATLGMYVVAKLAERHGITARAVAGHPGTTFQVELPASLFAEGRAESSPPTDQGRHRIFDEAAALAETVPTPGVGRRERLPSSPTGNEIRTEPKPPVEIPQSVPRPSEPVFTPVSPTVHELWTDPSARLETTGPPESGRVTTDEIADAEENNDPAPPRSTYAGSTVENRLEPALPGGERGNGVYPGSGRFEPDQVSPVPPGRHETTARPNPGTDPAVLPQRSPGASFREEIDDIGGAVAGPSGEPGSLRDALQAFKQAREDARGDRGDAS